MNRLLKILTGLLLASAVFAQVIMLEPKDQAVSSLNHISVTIAGKAGSQASLFVNNVEAQSDIIRIDGLLDFLNVEVPAGPVKLRVEAEGAGGRTFTAEKSIHVLGPLKTIRNITGEITLPADGRSKAKYKFEFLDQWDYRLHDINNATVSLTAGDLIDEDIDKETFGHQVAVTEGFLTLMIQAPSDVNDRAELKIEARGFTQIFKAHFTIPEEPLIVVGGVNGALSTLAQDQDPDGLPHFGIINENNTKLGDHALLGGRAAFYAKGSLKPGLRLTASLDTDRGYLDQLFVDVDPEEQYPLFGDASSIIYDAQSRSKLYAKLEQNESFVMFGDYNTNLTDNEFTAYNRTFNGVLGNYLHKNHQLQVFGTATDRSMRQEEIRGEGISGFYYLDNGSLTRFSEKIRIVTKDRYHPEIILDTRNLTRFFDYDINYVDGTLMFKQPVAALDGAGNPIYIVIAYEYQGSNSRSWIGGIRQKSTFGKKDQISLGSTVIAEEQAKSAYLLYGMDAKVPLTDKLTLSGEIAQSRTPDEFTDSSHVGTALRTEVLVNPLPELTFKGYFRTVGDDFMNSSQVGSSNERGSIKYGMNTQYQSKKYGDIVSEFYNQSGTMGTSNTTNNRVFNLHFERRMNEKSTLKVGYENAFRERLNAADSLLNEDHSNLLKAEYNILLLDKIQAVFEHEQNLQLNNRTKPTNSSVGLVYPVTEQLEVYWKYRFIQGTGVKRQSVLGFRSSIGENTDIEAKYEIGGITGEQRNRASIGLNNKWQLREDLVVNVSLENTATVDSFEIPTPSHQAMALSFEYLPEMPWKAIGKYEVRDDASSLQRVITFGGDMRIFAGFGAIAKLDHWENRYKAVDGGSQTRENYQAGIAYRPEQSDQINVLAKLAYVSERNTHIAIPQRQDRYILSAHSYWQVNPWIGIGSRVATRYVWDQDATFANDVNTQTYFFQSRGEFAWNMKLSSILDARYIYLTPLGEGIFGLATELDYLVFKNLQFGAGYILKNYSDPDFAFLDYQYHNLYFTLHAKFSEDIFNWR